MGFSSFGAKPNPPKKKRKLASHPNAQGSGSNNTPLGARMRQLIGEGEEGEGEVRKGKAKGKRAEIEIDSAGVQGQEHMRVDRPGSRGEGTVTNGSANGEPDPLIGAAMDETAALSLERGLLPRGLDWGEADAGGGGQMGSGFAEGEMTRQGKRGGGEWDWQALRKGVLDERGDVAYYDLSFVEDPWRGLGGSEGRGEVEER